MFRYSCIASALMMASLAACSSVPSNELGTQLAESACAAPAIEDGWLSPRDANRLIFSNPEHCQPATIAMTVRSVMRVNDVLYLNSENDPRNWKNISLAILPQAQQELSEFFHGSPDDALEGKDLVVIGTARLVGPNLTNPGVIRVHVRESGVVHIVAAKGAYPSSMPARASEVIVESASQMWLKQPRASLDAPAH